MKKTLRIEVVELFSNDINKNVIYESLAGSTLIETETDIFFLLDENNYTKVVNYFSFALTEEQVKEIMQYFRIAI